MPRRLGPPPSLVAPPVSNSGFKMFQDHQSRHPAHLKGAQFLRIITSLVQDKTFRKMLDTQEDVG